ncbi:hypothetical protein Metev_1569 [Methanohalobium evestigatum Z-7303]|uniref:Uncharacterized protein n=1 Tax=Methanohalobium evestigatum (strain ATCC BAA-1072 / DSM 3721 / NBRC 107634 / OCM 161 / Z-7303) TaxID=644295 RepID=D7E9Z4_METEZ|nr:hypothetical protein [Methanohalobium evestigatum]ADI74416.1 hypothetical protein Metev_1569 [Methanohalobium evestigatum Z-7303]
MKIIKSLTIALVLLLSLVSFTVAAEQPPEPPLIVKGDVEINDEPAPEGTQVTAKLDGELIAKSTVEKPEEYELHLLKKDDYTGITFTVDGTESQPDSEIADELNNADPTKATYLDLSVTQSSSDQNTENQDTELSVSGGSMGGTSSSTTNDNQNDDNTAGTGTDSETRETTAGDNNPDASTGTNDGAESQESTAPEPEGTSNISLMVVGAIIIVGIIAAVGYKMKK